MINVLSSSSYFIKTIFCIFRSSEKGLAQATPIKI